MSNLNVSVINEIVNKCINLYAKLPKNGKPVENEWTILSCVVQYDNVTSCSEIVSLGSGTKCIGASKMSPTGDLLNDSHAEIIARRGFLVYLYDNMLQVLKEEKSIFTIENNKFVLKESIEFIFYSSQLPCGDAAIVSKSVVEEGIGEMIQAHKRHAEEDICELDNKKLKISIDDIHRTGAKCLPNSEQDLRCPGSNYHLLGQVRIKPGRGDRTLSVSCSDKMARWIHLGIQGALIDMLLDKPIFISSFIFGGGVPYSDESLERALLKRTSGDSQIPLEQVPQFHVSSIVFPHIKKGEDTRPAPGSIIWIKLKQEMIEVAVQGRKLGLTKKKAILPKNSLYISKYNLYRRFQEVILKNELLQSVVGEEDSIEKIPYNEMKRKSKRYLEKWAVVKDKFFKTWTVKPDIWNFCVTLK